ncbi:unnamed protein product, partial [Prorocentrum cordatum]
QPGLSSSCFSPELSPASQAGDAAAASAPGSGHRSPPAPTPPPPDAGPAKAGSRRVGDYAHGVGKVSPKAEAPSVQGSPLGPLSEDQSYTPPPQQAAAPRRRSATPGTTCTSGTRRRA